jgi:predicted transcriptional regulator
MKEIAMTEPAIDLKGLTADIVGAHVANNSVATGDLPLLIKSIYEALSTLGEAAESVEPEKKAPAVAIRSSVKPDYIVCLEDGKKLKMMKRYLASRYNLTPAQYRQKWGRPSDYPMVAPNYSEARKALANAIGLGRKPTAKVVSKAAKVVKKVEAAAKPVVARAKQAVAVVEQQVETVAKPVRARAKKAVADVVAAVAPAPKTRGRKPKSA